MPTKTEPRQPVIHERGRYLAWWTEGFALGIDGATGYRVRLLPSNKHLGVFPTSGEAARLVERELAAGRHERTLAIDWCDDNGGTGLVAAGHLLAVMVPKLL